MNYSFRRLRGRSAISKNLRGHKQSANLLRIETLEPRQMLSANPLITEFMASNSTTLADGDGQFSDWIEIHNPTAQPVDLAGWHLTDDAGNLSQWTFPSLPQTVLPADGYLVVFASGQLTDNYVDPSNNLHANFKLSAGGEYLALTDASANIVQEFAPEFPSQATDQSYGLDAAELGAYFTNPTPGAANDLSSILTVQVYVSEIMYHPSSNNPAEEYLEIYNGESNAIDLTGWQISGAVRFTVPSYTLAAGERLVIAADLAAFNAKYPSVANVVGGWQGRLSDSGETIEVIDSSGRVVDTVTYADEGAWATRERGPLLYGHRGWVWSDAHDGGGSSLELVSTSVANDYGQNWLASSTAQGTPGTVNSVADADSDVAPLILDTTQFPIIPNSSETVAITARLLDETASGDSARLFWRTGGAGSFNMVVMNDAGTGDDAVAGDLVFTGTIPAQANGAVVEFYLESEDESGNIRSTPTVAAPSGQHSTNLLYQVDNSFTLPAAGDRPSYRFIMTSAEQAELVQIGSNSTEGNSHARMNGTFLSITDQGIEVRYNVGIRNRGRSSRSRLPNSYHVDIPSDNPWQGIDAFNLNTQYTHLQYAGLQLYQATRGVSEDSQPVDLLVNGTNLSGSGSPSFGVYTQIETANSDFAANHFPNDSSGNLYRIIRDGETPGGDLHDLGNDPNAYRPFYDKKTNVGLDDYSGLIQLVNVLNNSSDAEYIAQLEQIVDIDEWVNYFAVNAILSTQETSLATGVGDDYLLYQGINDPRFVLIPHDMDSIFGQGDSTGPPTASIYSANSNPTIERFLTHPEIAPLYHNRLVELLGTTFSQAQLDPFLDQLLSDFTPANLIADMKSFMNTRRQFILDQLQTEMTVQSPLALQNGIPHTTQSDATLTGTVPLAGVGSVLVNGQAATLNPTDGTWSVGEATGGQTSTLIAQGSVWQYLDAGQVASTAPGSDWRIDDPGWTDSGNAQLGYGDGDEATTVSFIDTNPGQAGTQKNITTYFRQAFSIADASSMVSLTLRMLYDDGAVVFLNGVEVERPNMPAGTITSTTEANFTVFGSDESDYTNFTLDPALLVDGENVLAVEIHQTGPTSSDISFDLELIGSTGDSNTLSGFPLLPGINRVQVEAFTGPNGTGELVDTSEIDIWYDDGDFVTIPGGTISTDTTWSAASGPYVVTGDLTVANNATLTIEPGTSVFFNSGAGFTVSGTGRVVAEGTQYQRIRFAANPINNTSRWDGMNIHNTLTDNRFSYFDHSSGDAQGNVVDVNSGRVSFDHVSWFDVNNQVLDLVHPTLTVSNSFIPGISGDETVHVFGLVQGEQLIFDNNIFGMNTNGNDVVDLGHNTANPPTIIFRNNVFMGGFDDGIDTDGFHVLIENNTFMNFHLGTSRPTTSNAISTGHMTVGGNTISSNLTIIGNTFINNDHDLLLKDFSFATVTNNTFVGATLSTVQFTEIGGTSVIGPGVGADFDGNIFWNAADVFTNIQPTSQITLNRSIVPANLVSMGTGNFTADPLFTNLAGNDFSLQQNSPAIGAGPNGSEIGAYQLPDIPKADATNLAITELHYHPQAGQAGTGEVLADGDWFEFIELQNTSATPIDLSGVAFTTGIDFVFPWGASLEASERLLLVSNQSIFESRYGTGLRVDGEFANDTQLANGGETIRLQDATGTTILEFTYNDKTPWPFGPDGDGPSLVVVDTSGDYNDPANWTASVNNDGSPGTAEPIPADFDTDGDVDATDFGLWSSGYGTQTGATHATGDADLDGDVDGADFLSWQIGFGTGTPATASLTSENTSLSVDGPSPQDAALVQQDSSPQEHTRNRGRIEHRGQFIPPITQPTSLEHRDTLFANETNWQNEISSQILRHLALQYTVTHFDNQTFAHTHNFSTRDEAFWVNRRRIANSGR